MRALIQAGRVFELLDSSEIVEGEFTQWVVEALRQAKPAYRCFPFRGVFTLDGERRQPDLAIVAPDFSHWFVIEVELTRHSLRDHVIPQVRAFRFGDLEPQCVQDLANALDVTLDVARELLDYGPRSVAVVTEAENPSWREALEGLDVQVLSIVPFRSSSGDPAFAMGGDLFVMQESVGVGTYRVADGSILMPAHTALDPGRHVILDSGRGSSSSWRAVKTKEALWVTKERGTLDLSVDSRVQLIRAADGALSIRVLRQGVGLVEKLVQ